MAKQPHVWVVEVRGAYSAIGNSKSWTPLVADMQRKHAFEVMRDSPTYSGEVEYRVRKYTRSEP